MSLATLLYLLPGCGTSSISPIPTTNSTEQMATITAFARVTTNPILNVVGTYTGTHQWQGSSSSSPMRSEISRQEGISITGKCLLGQQSFSLLHAVTSTAFGGCDGVITFSLKIPPGQRQQANSLNFHGDVMEDGAMTGQVSSSDGKQGTWSVHKA